MSDVHGHPFSFELHELSENMFVKENDTISSKHMQDSYDTIETLKQTLSGQIANLDDAFL